MSDDPSTAGASSTQSSELLPYQALVVLRGLGGAIVGGVLGYLAFRWLHSHGLYGIMIVGALVGLGAALATRGKSVPVGILCAVLALPAGVLSEWHVMPFINDKSLSFFLANLPVSHWLFIGLGTAAAFWFGQGR